MILDDKMNMIRHQAEGVELGRKAIARLSDESEKRRPIRIVDEYRLSIISSRSHVVEPAGWMNPEWSRHSSTIRMPCDSSDLQPGVDGT